MLCLIALRGVQAHKNLAHLQHEKNIIYCDQSRVVELLLQLVNKQQCGETQHKHMYWVYIGGLCNKAQYSTLYLQRDFTGVHENLNTMKHSIEFCLL